MTAATTKIIIIKTVNTKYCLLFSEDKGTLNHAKPAYKMINWN